MYKLILRSLHNIMQNHIWEELGFSTCDKGHSHHHEVFSIC